MTTRDMIKISRQEVAPKFPYVQKTTAETFTSSAKYCSNAVPPENRELSATPVNTIDSGVTRLIRDSPRITMVDRIEPANAQTEIK